MTATLRIRQGSGVPSDPHLAPSDAPGSPGPPAYLAAGRPPLAPRQTLCRQSFKRVCVAPSRFHSLAQAD